MKKLRSLTLILALCLAATVMLLSSCGKQPYDVTFINGSETKTVTVTEEAPLSLPDTPVKDGYSFGGWYFDKDSFTIPFSVEEAEKRAENSGSVSLYAKWEINEYTVTFLPDNESESFTSSVNHGDIVHEPKAPEKDSYHFVGWYNDDTRWNFADPISKDTTLTARWALNAYDVTFNPDNGEEATTVSVEHNETLYEPKVPVKEGYHFIGWYLGNEAYDFKNAITSDLSLTAKWEINTYVITFISEYGEPFIMAVNHGDCLELPDLERDKYEFTGWYKVVIALETLEFIVDEKAWDVNTPVTSDLVLLAGWERLYSVTLHYSDTESETTIYKSNQFPITLPVLESTPVSEFTGWYLEKEYINKISSLNEEGDYELYAGFLIGELPQGSNWPTTTLIFEMTDNSSSQELLSGCKRYLAGSSDDFEPIDDDVDERNEAAYAHANVEVTYTIMPDQVKYGWSQNIDRIFKQVYSSAPDSPDMYCNFVYDMVSTSLKGSFANLYSKTRGEGDLYGENYFDFTSPDFEESGSGYMYEYMKSLTLSKHKMYLVASDYFIDTMRAAYVIPVNIGQLNTIKVAEGGVKGQCNSDRTGDGKFNIDDFYQLVWDYDWTYQTLSGFSDAYFEDEGTDDAVNLNDRICFALSSSARLSSSGILYTTSITIINRNFDDDLNDYKYSYPEPEEDKAQILFNFCETLADLFSNNKGIIAVSNADTFGLGDDSLQAIRNQFCRGRVLFGGVILLGSLEYEEYQKLNEPDKDGFGVAPVPLYTDINPTTGTRDRYLTQIHNIGRIGAIAASTDKFAQCTAFLNYVSLNSTDILNNYYEFKLQYDAAGGSDDNIEMLQYIRENVRSSFDKAFEDAIGKFFLEKDPNSNEDKWHMMIMRANYVKTNMEDEYKRVYEKKANMLKSLVAEYDGLPD